MALRLQSAQQECYTNIELLPLAQEETFQISLSFNKSMALFED